MKQLTISYLDHHIHFHSAAEMQHVDKPINHVVIPEQSLDQAFLQLIAGKDVWVWVQQDFRTVVRYLRLHYIFVKAAGGIPQASDGRQLLIFRENNWDIPKGMVEPGETLAQAAVREVEEETGLQDLSIGPLITKTYHIYDKYGGWHLKQTSWYHIQCPYQANTIPQTEEGITQAVWVTAHECRQRLSQSFASLRIVSDMLA